TYLLNGSAKTLDFQIGLRGNQDNYISFDAGKANASASSLGVSGSSIREKESARDLVDKVENAINQVGSMRANFGAIQSRMQSTINTVEVGAESFKAAFSRIRDADIAQESADLAKTQIIRQAGVATLAQANASTAMALKL